MINPTPISFKEDSHLGAELTAFAVLRVFPNVILLGGGINSLGFYYDFIFEKKLSASSIELIELQLHRIVKDALPIRSISMMRENAQAFFEHHGHYCLAERVGEFESNVVELLQIGDFYGLSPPLSLTSTAEVGAVKIVDWSVLSEDSIAEAGVVIRLQGVSRCNAQDLKKFLKKYQSFLKKNDHRLLGPQLRLFTFSSDKNCFDVIWHPKGMQLKEALIACWNRYRPVSFSISTPLLIQEELLKKNEHVFEPFSFQGASYVFRPSLQDQHFRYIERLSLSQELLPWRMVEQTAQFRPCPESQSWGLLSACSFHSMQMTICCMREQVLSELISSLHFIEQMITLFDFKAYWVLVSPRLKKVGDWRERESLQWLANAYQGRTQCNDGWGELREREGDAPSLELHIQDVLGRSWRIACLSVSALDASQRRFLIFQQFFESLDCFVGLLIEQTEGCFPFWLAPEQVRVIAIGQANHAYARQVVERLEEKQLRVNLDTRDLSLNVKIHEAEKENIPYLVLIGEQERVKKTVSVRLGGQSRQKQVEKQVDSLEEFLEEIYQKSLGSLADNE